MPAHRLVRHSFSEGVSFRKGGSIARRPSPGRNRRRACRAATGSIAPQSQPPATDLNAKPQWPIAATRITDGKFSMADSQCLKSTKSFRLRDLSVFLFKALGSRRCAFAAFRLRASGAKSRTRRFQRFALFPFFQLYFQRMATRFSPRVLPVLCASLPFRRPQNPQKPQQLLIIASLCRPLPPIVQNTHHPSKLAPNPPYQTLTHLSQSFAAPKLDWFNVPS